MSTKSFCDCCGQILTMRSALDARPGVTEPSSKLGDICTFCGWEQDETPEDTDANHATRDEWLLAYQAIRGQIWRMTPGEKSRAVLSRIEIRRTEEKDHDF